MNGLSSLMVYGPEGSGKTTQAKRLARRYRLEHISTGDMIRHFAYREKAPFSGACRRILEQGTYLGDRQMLVIVRARLSQLDRQDGFILDGFPRNLAQARWLDRFLDSIKHPRPQVIYLKLDRETAIRRTMARGRDGHDTAAKIKTRINQYRLSEKQTVSYYRNRKRLWTIDASLSIPAVYRAINRHIERG